MTDALTPRQQEILDFIRETQERADEHQRGTEDYGEAQADRHKHAPDDKRRVAAGHQRADHRADAEEVGDRAQRCSGAETDDRAGGAMLGIGTFNVAQRVAFSFRALHPVSSGALARKVEAPYPRRR